MSEELAETGSGVPGGGGGLVGLGLVIGGFGEVMGLWFLGDMGWRGGCWKGVGVGGLWGLEG